MEKREMAKAYEASRDDARGLSRAALKRQMREDAAADRARQREMDSWLRELDEES